METRMRFVLVLSAALTAATIAKAADPVYPSSAGNLLVQTVASGLVAPWALAFLPDGRMLVTERPGRMRNLLLIRGTIQRRRTDRACACAT